MPKKTVTKRTSTKSTRGKSSSTRPKKTTSRKRTTTRKYSPSSQNEVKKEMHRFKRGTAKSGKGGAPVKSRKQAIAIGLSKARAKGAKVPKKVSNS